MPTLQSVGRAKVDGVQRSRFIGVGARHMMIRRHIRTKLVFALLVVVEMAKL